MRTAKLSFFCLEYLPYNEHCPRPTHQQVTQPLGHRKDSEMAFVPSDARWYLAEIVEEIQIADEPQNVVHVNITLVQAETPEEALVKANKLGLEGELIYENTEGKKITITYRGLRDLNVIHGELKHGAELTYEEKIGLTKDEVNQIVRPTKELGVFQPIVENNGPNYLSKDIMNKVSSRNGKNRE